MVDIITSLQTGLKALDLYPVYAQIKHLADFLTLLEKWNQVYNLTAVRDINQMISSHLFDSLAVHAYIEGPRVIDIGSGAGLPGIPLAICLPHIEFVLVDSNAKKTRFVQQATHELRLVNIRVLQMRIEDYTERAQFDTVMCRAFGRLAEFVSVAGGLCKQTGRMLALKGRYPSGELTEIPERFKVKAINRLKVPCLNKQRHVVEIIKV